MYVKLIMSDKLYKCSSCGAEYTQRAWENKPYGCCMCNNVEYVLVPYEKGKMTKDLVNNPAHYTYGKIEVIDFIEDKKLNFHRGNCVKYITRAGKKDPNKEIEDLKKAEWYLKREIERLEKAIE